jgi:outer membrane protein assembly factor BamB
MIRRLAVALLMLGLAACTSYGGGGREDLPPPEPDDYQADIGVKRIWQRSVGTLSAQGGFALQPVVAGDRVYVASVDGKVHALDKDTGKPHWQRDLGHPLSAGPAVADGLLVVGSRDGDAVGLRASDGEELWRSGVTSEILARPAVSADLVVVRVADGRVFGLDAATGRRRWLYEQTVPVLTLRGTSSPILVPGQLVVVGFDTGRLVALTPEDGRPVWDIAVAAPKGRTDLERMVDIDADPVMHRADIYVASHNGRLASIDANSGRARWDRELSVVAGLAVDAERVYATDAEDYVWAFDRFSGATVWRQEDLRGLRLTGPAVFRDHLLVGDDAGYLNWLALRDGSLQNRQRIGGAFVAVPVVQGDTIYLLTENGLTVLR